MTIKHQSKHDKCEHFLLAFSMLTVLHYVIGVYKINNKKKLVYDNTAI